ncbi:glycosyltransferase [Microbacterium sp. ET2]|uniref:glycosyltransferase n=1 Tax=Microbacterium albipurpureum TaxID=3050384 RepID=UPI00259CD847|nr:glycosyltransferase [Microbacterium sp. ET2 (Ac-2212)]WJL94735.1 glycosyltransferase [Microbacterium sp. ET2 (Ac-2212)]
MTALTVVVPAHDEEALIEGTLRRILSVPAGEIDLIVVANGCSDATAERARSVEGVRVIETARASKIAALNAGSDAVETYPVAFVDADVAVDGQVLLELARRLDDDAVALVAAPRLRVLPSRSWWVRQYYRVWALTDYRTTAHVGSGIYMLREAGRERFGEFPDVIADDLFVQRLFAPDERLAVGDLEFTVQAPATLRALVGRNGRIAAGNRQLAQERPDLTTGERGTGVSRLARRVAPRPGLWAGFVVYSVVYLLAQRRGERMLRSTAPVQWTRDDTTRVVS